MLLHFLTLVTNVITLFNTRHKTFFLVTLCFLCPLNMLFICWLFNEKNRKYLLHNSYSTKFQPSTFPMNLKLTVITLNSILFIITMLITSQASIIRTILTYKIPFTSFKIFRIFSATYVSTFLMKKIRLLFALQFILLGPISWVHFIHFPKVVPSHAIKI